MKSKFRMHNRQRQLQKLSRRMVIIMFASFSICMVIGLTVFFNLSRVDKSVAGLNDGQKFIISDQEFTTEMSLSQPIVVQQAQASVGVQLVRPAKDLQAVTKTLGQ